MFWSADLDIKDKVTHGKFVWVSDNGLNSQKFELDMTDLRV